MRSSGARVLKMSPRPSENEVSVNERNLKVMLLYLGTTEEEMLKSFYDDNFKDKLIITDKEKFKRDYTKAYIKIYTDKANQYSDCS